MQKQSFREKNEFSLSLMKAFKLLMLFLAFNISRNREN